MHLPSSLSHGQKYCSHEKLFSVLTPPHGWLRTPESAAPKRKTRAAAASSRQSNANWLQQHLRNLMGGSFAVCLLGRAQ